MRWSDSVTNSMDMNLNTLGDSEGERSGVLQSTGSQRVTPDLATEQVQQPKEKVFFKKSLHTVKLK